MGGELFVCSAGYHHDSVTCLGQDDSIYRQGDADTAMGGETISQFI